MEILLDNGPRPGRRTDAVAARSLSVSGSIRRALVFTVGVLGALYVVASVVMTVSGGF